MFQTKFIIWFAANLFLDGRFQISKEFLSLVIYISCRDGSKSCYCNRRERFHKKSVGTYKGKKNQLDKILNVKWDKEIHTQWESVHALGQLQNNAFVRE